MKTRKPKTNDVEMKKINYFQQALKQNRFFTIQKRKKYQQLTFSFLSSRPKTGKFQQIKSKSKEKSLLFHEKNYHQLTKSEKKPIKRQLLFSQNNRSNTIELKPVPLQKQQSKNFFGWMQLKTNNCHQKLTINKTGRSYSISIKKYTNQWMNTLKQLKTQFNLISQKLAILPSTLWPYLISKFQNFHLNINQKQQLLQLFCKFFERNFDLSQQPIFKLFGSFFGLVNKNNEFQFCQEIGTKFHKMENRIFFKHKYSLQYAKFIMFPYLHNKRFYSIHFSEFKFNLDESQVFQLFAIVRQFCQNNLDSFAFITLYFQLSLGKRLKKENSKQITNQYIELLQKLANKYPPNEELNQQNQQNQIIYGIQSMSSSHQYEIIYFQKSKKRYIDQLKQFILKKAEQAKQDQNIFRQLIEDICFKYGYSFKSGVKIKSSNHKASVFRTVQKLMQKQKYKSDFQKLKKINAQNDEQTHNFAQEIELQISKAQEKIQQILKRQGSIEFDAKDLVRGKCTFTKIQQIVQTVKILRKHVEAQGFKIIELKNRLRKQTKDISLIIQLQFSVAQLQLVLKMDSISNEFNHKIFQLTRSFIHNPITNLFIHNQRWCQTFFTDQFQLFQEIISLKKEPQLKDEITFTMLKKDITLFKKNFLQPNQLKYEKAFKVKQQEKIKVLLKIKEIKQYGTRIIPKQVKLQEKQISQKQNVINFLKSFDYKLALQYFGDIYQTYIQTNFRLLKLKGDVLMKHQKYKESLQCYQKFIENSIQNNKIDLSLAEVFQSVGYMSDIKHNFQTALQFYQKSLGIKQKIIGQRNIDISTSLNGIGQVYSNMKTKTSLIKAHEYHEKALLIRTQILGKQHIDVATSLNNIGVVYRRQGKYYQALDFCKRSLQIRQKLIGKQSLDAATSLYNIGVIYHGKEENEKSLEYLIKSIQIASKILGKQSIDVAKCYLYVSYVFQKLDNLQKAQNSIYMAYLIFKKVLGQDHVKTKLSYQQYSDIKGQNKQRLKRSQIIFYRSYLQKKFNYMKQGILRDKKQSTMVILYKIIYLIKQQKNV